MALGNFDNYIPLRPGEKVPAIKDWKNTKPGMYSIEAYKGRTGIVLTDGELVLDFDPKNYPKVLAANGEETQRDLYAELTTKFPSLLTFKQNKTPSGSRHIYLLKPSDARVKQKQARFPGVDFLDDKDYVRAVGTKDPDGREIINVVDGPIGKIPKELFDLLELEVASSFSAIGITESDYTLKNKAVAILENMPPANPGERNAKLYEVANQLKDMGFIEAPDIYQLMRDHWVCKWPDPVDDAEILACARNAIKYGQNAPGADAPSKHFTPEMAPKIEQKVLNFMDYQNDLVKNHSVPQGLDTEIDKNGTITKVYGTVNNVIWIMSHDDMFRGKIRYNLFTKGQEWKGKAPWKLNELDIGEQLTKIDYQRIRAILANKQDGKSTYVNKANSFYGMKIQLHEVQEGIDIAASNSSYHPVIDYLKNIKWDGVPRLDEFLPKSTGCANELHKRIAGRKLLIAAVKRVYEPGCKQDYMLLLESFDQGTKKSVWIEELGKPWHSVGMIQKNNKDTYIALRGKWIVEIPEANDVLTKNSHSWLKALISTAVDTYRGVYDKNSADYARSSIYIGTLNPGHSGEYLIDYQNRRYLPLKTGNFNIDWLVQNRDQLFAEAKAMYDAKESSWIDNKLIFDMWKQEQEERRIIDPWLEYLKVFTKDRTSFTPVEMYQLGLHQTANEMNSAKRTRAYNLARELGFDFDRQFGIGGTWVKKKLTWNDVL